MRYSSFCGVYGGSRSPWGVRGRRENEVPEFALGVWGFPTF